MPTMIDALDACRELGDERGYTFIASDGSAVTLGFRTLVDEARRRGRQLSALGLGKGDRVALIIPDSQQFVLTFLGAMTAGIVPVPLYPPLSLGRLDAYLDGMARTLDAAAVDIVIASAQVEKLLWGVMPRVKGVRDLVTVEALAVGGREKATAPVIEPSDPVFLQFTSGSTAAPKGVVVTHASLYANCFAIIHTGLRADPAVDTSVSWLPLYHDMGLIGFVLAPLINGVSTVFVPTLAFVKRPTLWMDVVDKYRGTITFAPNFAFARLVKRASDSDLARWDLSCLRVVGCGAEPIHAATMRGFVERFGKAGLREGALLPCYGMAEATLAISFARLGSPLQFDAERVSCGRALPGHEIGIFDESGRVVVGEREVGEIRVRGPSVAAGYFREPGQTRAVFGADGWLRTGDLGYLADGELYISGRKKDILIVHGRNYYPQAIEWIAEEVAGVRKGNIAVFSVPGDVSERVVIVAEATRDDTDMDADVRAAVQKRVAEAFGLVVDEVVLLGVGELPKTTSGKLQRAKTREQYLAGTLGREGTRSAGAGRAASTISIMRHVAAGSITQLRYRVAKRISLAKLVRRRRRRRGG
jgi:fatty-acyl-CoA synthase